ncbi:TPA: hypothetical protein QCJ95_003647 [Enterobacter asburiae]|nr:hypothetical protein [Enterobacter asburiae]HDR2800461.1 hypothetical protein [Enterobacter asburiae]
MQRFAKVAGAAAPNLLGKMMFLKGSFCFPPRSNACFDVLMFLVVDTGKPYVMLASGSLAGIWFLRNPAELVEKKI